MCEKINKFIPILFFCYIGIVMLVTFVFSLCNIKPSQIELYMINMLAILAPVFVYIIIYKINIIKCMPYRKLSILNCIGSLIIGYLIIPFAGFLNSISMLFSKNYIADTIVETTSYPFAVQLLFIAVMPAIVEEFVFRGLIYHSYRKTGILGAAVLSGIIFGLMHFNLNQFMYAMLIGMFFALLVEATGSMYSSMLAHFAINSYSPIMLLIQRIKGGTALEVAQAANVNLSEYPPAMLVAQYAIMFVIALAFLCLAYFLFRTMSKSCGRWDYLREQLSCGFKPQNGEKFITLPLVGTILAVISYMVFLEIIV